MGSKTVKRENFFRQHPTCCFCGGTRPAEEIDHVPSRVLFKNRAWPEGFEFPACSKCNRESALDEQVIALLALVNAEKFDSTLDDEFKRRLQALANNLPAIFNELKPTTSQLREASRKYGIKPAHGQTYRDLPLLSVKGPLVSGAVQSFGRKLGCALFYKHTHCVAPTKTPIAVRWYSNLQINNEEIPRALSEILPNIPTLKRAGTSLDDQFFYRWGVSDTQMMGVFLAFFRQSFAMLIFVNASEREPTDLPVSEIVYPYEWP